MKWLRKKTFGFDGRIDKGGAAEDSTDEGGHTLPPAHGRSLSRRAPLLWLVLPFMAGLAAGRLAPDLPAAFPLAVCTAGASLSAWVALRRPRIWAVALLAAMASAGYASYVLHYSRLSSWDDRPEREAVLEMRIERVFPSPRPARIAGLAVVTGTESHLREIRGQRIYFSLAKPKDTDEPIRSATVSAIGVLGVVPRRPAPETLDARLAGLGLNFRLTRGRLLRAGPPGPYYRSLETLARRMTTLLRAGFERRPDLGGIYRAMMLGQKQDLARGQRDLFLRSGTMHLFAINGLHIDIVAVSVHALLTVLRCSGLCGCGVVLGVLWLDVSATGNSPSAMRAFAMVGSAEAARAFRRPRNPLAALAAAALAALLLAPMDFFGASFQMSYGVVTVLLTFGVPLAERLQDRFPAHPDLPEVSWSRWQRLSASARKWLLGALAVGAAAALVGAITGIEFFGLFVPAGLVANLVVAPLAMLVIMAGVASLGVGLAGWAAASRFFNGGAAVLLRLIQALIAAGTRLPGSFFPAHYRADWIGPAAQAALLAACLGGYATGWTRRRGGFWPPVVVVAITLLLGVEFGG